MTGTERRLQKNLRNYSSLLKIKELKEDEIKVFSVVVGTVTGLLFGYIFGTTVYIDYSGSRLLGNFGIRWG